ncbi:MAG: hypothetical protein WAZ27_05170 [Minisyncoccia bacterium]
MNPTANNNDINEIKAKYAEITKRKPPVKLSPLAKKLIISGENLREFELFRENLLKELFPQSKIQDILAEKFISAAWKIQRAQVVEKNLLNGQNAITEEERLNTDSFGSISSRRRIRNIKRIDLAREDVRYVAHHQIELQKVMNKTLERLRAEQQLRNQQPPIHNEKS